MLKGVKSPKSHSTELNSVVLGINLTEDGLQVLNSKEKSPLNEQGIKIVCVEPGDIELIREEVNFFCEKI